MGRGEKKGVLGVSCWRLWELFRGSLQSHVIPAFDLRPLNLE